jgi:peptidoglycan/xylan/chitin deacetylase (PgdA/CDA1 family)
MPLERAIASRRQISALVPVIGLAALIAVAGSVCGLGAEPNGSGEPRIPILLYHRFGPSVADAMTVRTADFAAQLEYLRENGYHVIPLREVVAYARGEVRPPARAIAITADDGHKTVFTDMAPLVERYRVPVTLFIYPSAISNASYAMTWEELHRLKETGLFDIQSHTYWHPNFKVEKRRLSPAQYEAFVRMQFLKSRRVLDQRLGLNVDMLAWPFGIFDQELIRLARLEGYTAAFTMVRASVKRGDNVMILPRYLMTDEMRGRRFAKFIERATAPARN